MSIYIESFRGYIALSLLTDSIPLLHLSLLSLCNRFSVAATAESTARTDFSIACRMPSHCSWLFHWEDCCLVSVHLTLNRSFVSCFITLERKMLIVSDFTQQFLAHKQTSLLLLIREHPRHKLTVLCNFQKEKCYSQGRLLWGKIKQISSYFMCICVRCLFYASMCLKIFYVDSVY